MACVFAFFLGGVGVHKFYLGKIGQGVLYAVFAWSFIPVLLGLIDFIRLAMLSQDEFDMLYNNEYVPFTTPRAGQILPQNKNRTRRGDTVVFPNNRTQIRPAYNPARQKYPPTSRPVPLNNNKVYKDGIKLFDDYRYREALEQFKIVFQTNSNNPELLFWMACCNALLEQKEELFHNLESAIKNGFKDFERIRTTDALAYFRIQKEYDAIEASGFVDWSAPEQQEDTMETDTARNVESTDNEEVDAQPLSTDELLTELKRLGEMRQNGMITEEEFFQKKQKLYA